MAYRSFGVKACHSFRVANLMHKCMSKQENCQLFDLLVDLYKETRECNLVEAASGEIVVRLDSA